MNDEIRELAARWFEEVWNKERREAIGEILAPKAVIHDGENEGMGPEGFYPFYDRLRAAFPDLRIKVEHVMVEGDLACVRWSCTMTHKGEGLGMPATGKALRTTGITMVRVAGGKFVEGWQNWDMLGLMQQIEAAPASEVLYV